MDDIDSKIAVCNQKLKAANLGVRIGRKGRFLNLRATLPPKPGSHLTIPSQQRISLGLHSTPEGVKQALAEAKKLGALLDCREFDWALYLKTPVETNSPRTVGDWVEQFERDYFQRRKRNHQSETTWNGDYKKILSKLPAGVLLTREILHNVVLSTEPDSKTRIRACMVAKTLAKFAGIDYDPSPYRGRYSPKRVSPRDLPTDEEIVSWLLKIDNTSWQWTYGMIAAYGLRPHEVFHLDIEHFKEGGVTLRVLAGKTGDRRVWPCYPDWVEQWELNNVEVPKIKLDKSNSAIGSSCAHYFHNQIKLPFTLYDLRHCWAIRTLEFGLDATLAAQQMGHSAQVHSELYHHWISDRHHQKAFESLINRPNCPRPP